MPTRAWELSWRLVFKNTALGMLLSLQFLIWFIFAIYFYFKIFPLRHLHKSVALHSNEYFGIDQVGDWWQLAIIPLIWLVLLILNSLLALGFYQRDKHFAYGLIFFNLFGSLPCVMALYYLIHINL